MLLAPTAMISNEFPYMGREGACNHPTFELHLHTILLPLLGYITTTAKQVQTNRGQQQCCHRLY